MNRALIAGMCYVQAILVAASAAANADWTKQITALAVATMYATAGWGLFRRRRGARTMALGLGALEILSGSLVAASGAWGLANEAASEAPASVFLVAGLLAAVLGGLKLWILSRPRIRREFSSFDLNPTPELPPTEGST